MAVCKYADVYFRANVFKTVYRGVMFDVNRVYGRIRRNALNVYAILPTLFLQFC